MLKPSDIKTPTPDTSFDAAIEDHIDTEIRNAEAGGQWPCVVHVTRSGWPTSVIDRVLAKYSAAGWVVRPGPWRDVICTISHPDAK